MKDSAITHVTHEARPDEEPPGSAFQRFAKVMRALVAVPKQELNEKLIEEKATKRGPLKVKGRNL
jgi:hypothetical protein